MTRFLLFLLAPLTLAASVVNSSTIQFDNVGHASLHITYQLTSGNPIEGRIRYAVSPATCTGGTGGTVFSNYRASGEDSWWRVAAFSNGWFAMPLHGLSPSTTYQICPEVTDDGSTWSTGAGATVTTDSVPAIHPALPKAVQRFNTDYPNTTGYTTVSINSTDCTAIRDALTTAIGIQNTTGTVISIAAGSACTGRIPVKALPPDVVWLSPANFNTSTWIISSPSAVSEGQALAFSATNTDLSPNPAERDGTRGVLPGAYDGGDWKGPDGGGYPLNELPFATNAVVYAHTTCSGCDSTHFQVYAKAPFSAGLCSATSPLSENGNIYPAQRACPILWQFNWPGSGKIIYAPLIQDSKGAYVRNLKWIIIRTSTPDAQFVPEHVRLQGPRDANGDTTPPTQWVSKMASVQAPNSFLGNQSVSKMLFQTKTGAFDQSYLYFAANIRFVGMEITYQPYPQANYTNDQPPGLQLIQTSPDSTDIIFDRCWIHGYDPPFRTYTSIEWNGRNNAIIDSYVNDFNFPRQFNVGLGVHP
jgi:hypothetical protein